MTDTGSGPADRPDPPDGSPSPDRSRWDEWSSLAGWWQDTFTAGADAEYEEQILPLVCDLLAGARRVVEVGSGEGQVVRALGAAGQDRVVVGVEPVPAQLATAAVRGGGRYVRGEADALPVADASMDGAVVCLVLEHLEGLDGPLDELARVVAPGGRVVVVLNHPLLQPPGSGWVEDYLADPPQEVYQVGPYLVEQITDEPITAGVSVRFVHRPMHRYVNGLLDAGFALERILEPVPPDGYLATLAGVAGAATMPRLLVLVGRRTASEPDDGAGGGAGADGRVPPWRP